MPDAGNSLISTGMHWVRWTSDPILDAWHLLPLPQQADVERWFRAISALATREGLRTVIEEDSRQQLTSLIFGKSASTPLIRNIGSDLRPLASQRRFVQSAKTLGNPSAGNFGPLVRSVQRYHSFLNRLRDAPVQPVQDVWQIATAISSFYTSRRVA